MTKERAELLTEELRGLLNREQIIFVESREWEQFMPKHVSLEMFGGIYSTVEVKKENYLLNIVLSWASFTGLDYPFIDIKTILFTSINTEGNKIHRSFTLAREWKNNQEMVRWTQLKYALI